MTVPAPPGSDSLRSLGKRLRKLRKDRKLMLDGLYQHYREMPVGADAFEARDQAKTEGMEPPEEALKMDDSEEGGSSEAMATPKPQ